MVKLILAEKPSVARDIARVVGATGRRDGYLEGGGYRVAWSLGHLLELREPHEYDPAWKRWAAEHLPMLPEELKLRPIRKTAAHLRRLKELMRAPDIDGIINGCDAGREGEHIFRLVYRYAFGASRGKPVRRLWISSLTDQAVRAGMGRLRPSADYDRLADAARCRAEADWLVGLNATRAMTIAGRRGGGDAGLLSVGRVQTPTLAMLVRREEAIEAFVPQPFWKVHARLDGAGARWQATWTRGKTDRLGTEPEARAIAAAVDGRRGVVSKVERKQVRERPPFLYDLTALQKAANRRYGLSAEQTLKAAQGLYERHKAITYPRTDSRFLTSDMAPKLPALVKCLEASPWGDVAREVTARGVRPGRRVVNDAEVGDHHAIIPTGRLPNADALGPAERRVFELVARRLLAALLPDAVFAATRIETTVAEHVFVASGRVRMESGWQVAEPPAKAQSATPELPRVEQGTPADVLGVQVEQGTTQPPKRHSEATLLASMERPDAGEVEEDEVRRAMKASGLGTPATRAAIIETLLRRDYVRREQKALVPTPLGRSLVHALPVPDLLSAELTGAWEARLARMAEGAADRARFMADIREFTARAVAAIGAAPVEAASRGPREVLGRCPVCGTPVTEGRAVFTCERGRECTFVIPKRIAGRKTSPALAKVLLGRGRSQVLKGFRSKKGKSFSTTLVLREDGTVGMDFEARAQRKPAEAAPARPAGAARCPKCKRGHVVAGRRGWGCSRWREGCDFVVWFVQGGLRLPEDEADRLFRRRQTRLMTGLTRAGKARLVLDLEVEGNVRVEPGKRG